MRFGGPNWVVCCSLSIVSLCLKSPALTPPLSQLSFPCCAEQGVAYNPSSDTTTLTIDPPTAFTHLGVVMTVEGREVDMRAEVGGGGPRPMEPLCTVGHR